VTCQEKKQQKSQEITFKSKEDVIVLNSKETENCQEMKNLTNMEDIKDFYEYTEECMKRIIKLQVPDMKEIEHLRFNLPKTIEEELKYKKLAIFDLDETLVHAEIKNPKAGEVQLKVKLPNGNTQKVILIVITLDWVKC
jgi:hypothetical protein